MIREITIGQYYPVDSLLHRLDPRTKLFGTMIYIVSLFLANSWAGYLLAGSFLVLAIVLSKVPVKFMLKGLQAVIVLLLLSVSFNLFLTEGEVLVQFGILQITREGVRLSIFMGLRLIFLVVGSSIMTLTTTPNALTDGLEKSLGFLRYIRVPIHEIAMMMSIALRFIPILIEETDKIMKAQMARGADFEGGGIGARVKAMIPLLVPLFISAFRRAIDLSMAMEARCYHGGEGRTRLKPLKYKGGDYLTYGVCLIYLGLCVCAVVFLGKG